MASLPDAKAAMAATARTLGERVRRGEVNESRALNVLASHSEAYTDSISAAWKVYDYGLEIFNESRRNSQEKP